MPAVQYKNMYIEIGVRRDRLDAKLTAVAEIRREKTGNPVQLFAWSASEFRSEQIAHDAALKRVKAWIDRHSFGK